MNAIKTRTVLGWYQLGAATIGGLVTVWAHWRAGTLDVESLALSSAPFAVVGTAGRWLLVDHRKAVLLTLIGQVLQIPIIFSPRLIWKFVAGVNFSVAFSTAGSSVYAGIETTWLVAWNRPIDQSSIGLNLVPIVVILLVLRMRRLRT